MKRGEGVGGEPSDSPSGGESAPPPRNSSESGKATPPLPPPVCTRTRPLSTSWVRCMKARGTTAPVRRALKGLSYLVQHAAAALCAGSSLASKPGPRQPVRVSLTRVAKIAGTAPRKPSLGVGDLRVPESAQSPGTCTPCSSRRNRPAVASV